MNGFI